MRRHNVVHACHPHLYPVLSEVAAQIQRTQKRYSWLVPSSTIRAPVWAPFVVFQPKRLLLDVAAQLLACHADVQWMMRSVRNPKMNFVCVVCDVSCVFCASFRAFPSLCDQDQLSNSGISTNVQHFLIIACKKTLFFIIVRIQTLSGSYSLLEFKGWPEALGSNRAEELFAVCQPRHYFINFMYGLTFNVK